ncbi:Eco57I restriction-modification methylase domain-containing protein [Zunongwangia sp. H14]|uniref:Eco57I restriction-modification methylase domain-containing protein n=1 Tax=Zunongwangia sp. H14 TaxID=3240792 RepID=UPI0035693155
MNRDKLKSILQSGYKREDWRNVLSFLSGNKDLLKQRLEPKEIVLGTQKASKIVKELYELGTLTTTDGVQLPIFEIELHNNIKIEYNKVGVNPLIKDYILRDAGKGAIATFHYSDDSHQEWRFSFISKFGGSEFFEEVEDVETNPKKFTYIFGTPEEHRTALDRLYNLEQSTFKLEDFFEAFNVEPVSNSFFKEYKNFYVDFVNYISQDESSRRIFEEEKSDDLEKDIRNFVKRLLGRIVFLYFLQKKHWLGASNTDYVDGDTNFLAKLFEADKENFYTKWLSKLFFSALNTPNRSNDGFLMPDGENLCIPFLNGGLFEENQEPKRHRELRLPYYLFEELFSFFNGYNFTIYENSPEDHTVAVDPEMLGNIFENLLEDNNDKGTFYTPKEIVHYMTQESLIEYLSTHLSRTKEEVENLVRNQVLGNISREDLMIIESLIDKVKICDPAIGSGAFPMGLLQEIFNLKAFLHYELGYDEWNPAKIKQDIIQNSIYGVDIEEGAVDIARLRFWLSLVVDEDKPQPLPNLDYKIMQGNSVVESFKGIDLSNVSQGKNVKIAELDRDLFGNIKSDQINLTFDKVGVANSIEKKTRKYFTASVDQKPILKKQINDLVLEFIEYNIELRQNQIDRFIDQIERENKDESKRTKKQNKKYNEWLSIRDELIKNKAELKELQYKEEKPFFLWHLFFADVFKEGGFDIIIGNPPYIKEYTNRNAFDEFRNTEYYQGKMDLWYGFACKGLDWLKDGGVECFIAQNNWITSAGASILRNEILSHSEIKTFIDFGDYKVFQSAGIQTMIYLIQKKNQPSNEYNVLYGALKSSKIDSIELSDFLQSKKSESEYFEKYTQPFKPEKLLNSYINFYTPAVRKILQKIRDLCSLKLQPNEATNGIHTHHDYLSKAMLKKLDSNFKVGDGIFALSTEELENLNLSTDEKELIKPYYSKTKKVNRYFLDSKNDEWVIYTSSDFKDPNSLDGYPNLKKHLDRFKEVITSDNKPYGLHRTRKESFFLNEKIVATRKCLTPTFTYSKEPNYFSAAFYIINSDRINLKYLTTFLNSKLISFWLKYEGKLQGNNFQVDKEPLMNIPIHKPDNYSPFIELFDVVHFIYCSKGSIIDKIGNDQLAQFFEEVIDGCFFEIYFKEEMLERNLVVIDMVINELQSVKLSKEFENEKLEDMNSRIKLLYNNMKLGEVQKRIQMFSIKSPKTLKPILES